MSTLGLLSPLVTNPVTLLAADDPVDDELSAGRLTGRDPVDHDLTHR